MGPWNIAANMYGMNPNAYNNQVALNDLCDLDFYSPMGAMGMNGSIFPGMGGIGMGGFPMGGTGYPMTPMYGGGNYQDYYKNYEQYQDFMVNNQVRQREKMRNADIRLNSPEEGIAKQAAILKEKIMQNEQQQIIPAYKSFVRSVKSMYGGNVSDEEIANRAATLYAKTYGVTITEDIRRYGNSSFMQGLYQSVTFGWADNKTKEENISELTGQPVSRYEKAKKVAGNAVGGALVGTAGAIGVNCLWKVKKPFFKALFRVPVLAAIGGVAAGIMAFANKSS